MAYYQVEATWRPDESGERLEVGLQFFQLTRAADNAPVSLGDLLSEDVQRERRLIGTARLAPQEPPTLLRVRRTALDWLREQAGMTGADSFELRTATQADIAFLDRLATLAPA